MLMAGHANLWQLWEMWEEPILSWGVMLRNFGAFQNTEKSLKATYNYTDREAKRVIYHCEGDILATQKLAKTKLQ